MANERREAGINSTISIGQVNIVVKGPEVKNIEISAGKEPPKPSPEKEKHLKTISCELKKASKTQAETPAKSGKGKIPLLKISGIPDKSRPLVQEIKKRVHIELLKRLNLKKMALSGISEQDLEEKAKSTISEILSELTIPLPTGVKLEQVERELIQEAIGLGPLEYLTELDDITEIMVNGPNHVYVESKGTLYRTDTAFADNAQVISAIERIVSPLGRRIDESSPMVDARLPDGSRVNAIIPPLSLVGPSITIRKFSKTPFEISDLINFGTIAREMAEFLEACVKVRKNIIISGGTGSGKTTLLNVLSSYLPNRERIITIEDAAELQLHQEHIVRLESKPPNIEGKGAISIRDLVRNSLRMRPDRIVVGECRGGEALDMLQAMNTGHDGSLTTVHANTPRDALARLETLVLMAGFDLPLRAIREQIASAIDIIVQVNRERDGSRKITHISEITKMEGDIITLQDIFVYKHEGWDENNKITGNHLSTGNIPTFMEDIERAKIPLDIAIFDNEKWSNN
ncbi:MAG: CpaF family protein [Lentisphaerae bacterium]|nr:CpaF family protein [Lentisphaerota bacterium]MCP4099940.1 CpaF family protein [Lentisphaerota bacterium]